jgi:hypothetical protein
MVSVYFFGSGTNFVLTWQSTPGSSYQVIGNTNPAAPFSSWSPVGPPITATDSTTSATNPISLPLGFFNVKSQ